MPLKIESKEFWDAIIYDHVAMDSGGIYCQHRYMPVIDDNHRTWRSHGNFYSLIGLNLTGKLPKEQWKESYISRPKTYKLADETTPVDTLVWAKDHYGFWHLRYYAKPGCC